MNHRVGVNHLDGARIRQRVFDRAAYCFAGRESQDRTETFAAVEQAITHRFEQPLSRAVRLGNRLCERALDEARSLFQITIEIKHSGSSCPTPTAPLAISAVRR